MILSANREKLMKLLDGRLELLPLIHDVLAEHHLSETAYAHVFELVNYSTVTDPSDVVAYFAPTKEWRLGKRVISDIKLFGLLDKACDIIRLYVRASWEDCIFSAWVSDAELAKAETTMTSMENMSHIRNILAVAAKSMVFNTDGTIDWKDAEAESVAEE